MMINSKRSENEKNSSWPSLANNLSAANKLIKMNVDNKIANIFYMATELKLKCLILIKKSVVFLCFELQLCYFTLPWLYFLFTVIIC